MDDLIFLIVLIVTGAALGIAAWKMLNKGLNGGIVAGVIACVCLILGIMPLCNPRYSIEASTDNSYTLYCNGSTASVERVIKIYDENYRNRLNDNGKTDTLYIRLNDGKLWKVKSHVYISMTGRNKSGTRNQFSHWEETTTYKMVYSEAFCNSIFNSQRCQVILPNKRDTLDFDNKYRKMSYKISLLN